MERVHPVTVSLLSLIHLESGFAAENSLLSSAEAALQKFIPELSDR
jgi:hypothetical protein